MEYLSNIELYFCKYTTADNKSFILDGEEFQHCIKVMRNKLGDKIYSTDGFGNIFEGIINEITKNSIFAKNIKKLTYINKLQHFTFCIPNLRNPERLKFALEKCTELGVTNFVVFNSQHTVSKGFKEERFKKIVIAAMKQSLRAFIPKISFINSISEIVDSPGEKVLFDQLSDKNISNFKFDENNNYFMLFGPEGGFSQKEIEIISPKLSFNLIGNRLRSETAIIKVASIIS